MGIINDMQQGAAVQHYSLTMLPAHRDVVAISMTKTNDSVVILA
jgi:hypothetical protein